MGAVPTLPAFVDALRTALVNRSGLSGVNVYTAPVAPEDEGTEAIIFGEEDADGTAGVYCIPAEQRQEEYEVRGRVLIVKSGAGETAIKAARDRAYAIYAEVASEVGTNDRMTGTVDDVTATQATVEQVPGDHVRICRIRFILTVKATYTVV